MTYRIRQLGDPDKRAKDIDAETPKEAVIKFAAELRELFEVQNFRPMAGPLYVVVCGHVLTSRPDGTVVIGLAE